MVEPAAVDETPADVLELEAEPAVAIVVEPPVDTEEPDLVVDKPVAMVDERPADVVEVDTMVDEPEAGADDTTPGVGGPMAKVVAEVTVMIVELPLVIVEAVCGVVHATPGVSSWWCSGRSLSRQSSEGGSS